MPVVGWMKAPKSMEGSFAHEWPLRVFRRRRMDSMIAEALAGGPTSPSTPVPSFEPTPDVQPSTMIRSLPTLFRFSIVTNFDLRDPMLEGLGRRNGFGLRSVIDSQPIRSFGEDMPYAYVTEGRWATETFGAEDLIAERVWQGVLAAFDDRGPDTLIKLTLVSDATDTTYTFPK